VGFDLVLIEGDDLEDPLERYTIPEPFYIMTTEVINAMYNQLMNNSSGDSYPKIGLSHLQPLAFTNALSENQGLEQCFSCEETNNELSCTESIPFSDYYECSGYTLSNQYEWELAARSGTTKQIGTGEGTLYECNI
jgi:formylglycine-generating enzyme required for sulfatase activity